MHLDKNKIRKRFDSASVTYESVACVQKESARVLTSKLINSFPDFQPASILDLGTGTGYVPELLLHVFPQSQYTLNDIAPKMLDKAREKFASFAQFRYHMGDMEVAQFERHDLVISNFALQWVDELECALRTLYNNTKVLAFSCLLQGTFEEWAHILQGHGLPSPAHEYPSQSALEALLLSLQPTTYLFEAQDFQLTFENAQIFTKYLKNLGASTSSHPMPPNELKQCLDKHNQRFNVTYKVFYGILKRSE